MGSQRTCRHRSSRADGHGGDAVVVGFTGSLLAVAWLLRELHLPQDLLRNLSIALLFVVAATLVVPQLGQVLERPLARLSRRPGGDLGGGFVLGLALGLVFVPCGGLVLAAITTHAATLGGGKRVAVAIAFAVGTGLPMLLIAYGGRRAAAGLRVFRAHAREARAGLGALIAAVALLITFHVDRTLANVGNPFSFADPQTSCTAQRHFSGRCVHETSKLADLGLAPDFRGTTDWFNSKPLSIQQLRGKVVLVDFWTYSCINCLRTLPHLKAWWREYHRAGLEIVGVQTPEFGFESVPHNVAAATKQLGVTWPVALDPRDETWKVGPEHTTAVRDARLALHFRAKDVYLVMGGRGRVRVTLDGHALDTIPVKGISRLYTVVSAMDLLDSQLRLSFTPGISVYSFTFG